MGSAPSVPFWGTLMYCVMGKLHEMFGYILCSNKEADGNGNPSDCDGKS